MAHRIEAVDPDGIAAQCGIQAGDLLLSMNGEPVLDQIDYQFFSAQERLLLGLRTGETPYEVDIEKDGDAPLGMTLASTLMSHPQTCANRCVFCFVDQMPPGLRDTLYVKDDDWRLSLMMGNYITLTNLSDRAFDRIIARRASPLYISVHATDPDVRAQMMGTPRAANLMPQLTRLADAGISFHCQIVLCPGLNDGAVLGETIRTLAALHPAARSAALVPVGLTGHRDGLPVLTPYDRASAAQLLEQAHGWQQRLLQETGTRFVFPADELYCLSGVPLPADEAYEGYPQIENGVGLLRSFEKAFASAYRHADLAEALSRRVLIPTGTSVAPFLRKLIDASPIPGVSVDVRAIPNRFFGPSVTVAGLLTGGDLLPGCRGAKADEVLISQAMLRHDGSLFLDDSTPKALSEALGLPVHIAGCDGADFFYALMGEQYAPGGIA